MRATLQDVPRLVEMAREFHTHHAPPWPFSKHGMQQFFGTLIRSDSGLVLVNAGFLAAVKVRNPLSPGWVIASEVLWWGNADLIREFRKWARDADEIRYSCPPEAQANRLFRHLGEPVETVYSEISKCV